MKKNVGEFLLHNFLIYNMVFPLGKREVCVTFSKVESLDEKGSQSCLCDNFFPGSFRQLRRKNLIENLSCFFLVFKFVYVLPVRVKFAFD